LELTLFDINPFEIETNIAPLLTQLNQKSPENLIKGIIWGLRRRFFVPISLQSKSQKEEKTFIFLVECNFPITFLSPATLKELGIESVERGAINLIVQRKEMAVEQGNRSFRGINVLGADFLAFREVRMITDYGKGKYTCCLEINNF
jgi:hypothetical protein